MKKIVTLRLYNFAYSGNIRIKMPSEPIGGVKFSDFLSTATRSSKSGYVFRQVVYKDPLPGTGTWLIFPSSLKFRLVGASSAQAANTSRESFEKAWNVQIENFVNTNFTAIGVLPKPMNCPFHRFAENCCKVLGNQRASWEPELLNALTLTFENVKINIFSSSTFVALGVRGEEQMVRLIDFLVNHLPIKQETAATLVESL